jgi:hypothetical protein
MFLTVRDVEILRFAFLVDGCTINELQTRFWTDFGRERGGFRRASYRRIEILVNHGYLRSHRLASLTGIGSGPRWLTIGASAFAVLKECVGASSAELRAASARQLNPFFVAHHRASVEFLASLEIAADHSNVVGLEWTFEKELRRLPTLVEDPAERKTITLIPDGAFVLRLSGGAAQSFDYEQDQGTIPRRLRSRLRGYFLREKAKETSAFPEKRKQRPVLWVVPDTHRLSVITSWAEEEARSLSADPSSIWLTTQDQITPERILTPIWRVVGVSQSQSLLPAGLQAPPVPQPATGELLFQREAKV